MKKPSVAVGALVFNKEGKLLIIKAPKWGNFYSIPGGHVEFGETLEEALKREIKEETGLNVSKIKPLLVHEAINPKDYYKRKHFIFIDYSCLVASDDVKLNGEGLSYKWVKPVQALECRLEPYTRKLIKVYLNQTSRINK